MSLHNLLLSQTEQRVVSRFKGLKPVKDIIDHKNRKAHDRYFANHPSKTHTKEELEAVHRAIAYTKMFKQQESLDKMNSEEFLERPLPRFNFSGRK